VARRTLALLTLASYLVPAALALLIVSRPAPLPQTRVEFVQPAFDGERAYANLAELVGRFPNRTTGSRQDDAAAAWMEERFRALGLTVSRQQFSGWGTFPSTGALGRHTGVNVLGISPGQSPEAIVIGAHRDVAPTTSEGAEDNGSGTVALLELARVLPAVPHHYTYVFISFGAEEVGLLGSRYYANHQVAPTALALSLDMMGESDGVLMQFGDYDWSQVPLPALQALFSLARQRDLILQGPQVSALSLLRLPFAGGGSDSAPFAAVGVPALHVAWGQPYYPYTHKPEDRLEQVSAASLARAGGLVESYVRAVDGNNLLAGPRPYLLLDERRYLTPEHVGALGALIVLFAVAQPAIALLALRRHGFGFGEAWLATRSFLFPALTVTAVLTLSTLVLEPVETASLAGMVAWAAAALGAFVALVVVARRSPPAPPALSRFIWRSVVFLAFAGMALLVGPFLAGALLVYHLLVLSHLSFRGDTWLAFDGCLLLLALLPSVVAVVVVAALGFLAGELFPLARYQAFLALSILVFLLLPAYRVRRAAEPIVTRTPKGEG